MEEYVREIVIIVELETKGRPARIAGETTMSANDVEYMSWEELVKQKQVSRDKDAEDLASGRKSVDDLRRENGIFYGIKTVIKYV